MPADGVSTITPSQCARASLNKIGSSYTRHSWTNGWF